MTDIRIKPFLFEGTITVRVIDRDGAPWFVTADVCRALGIANASQAVEGLDDDEKGISLTYTPSGQQQMLVISESGLYTIILRGRDALKPGTLPHRFRRWVTGEVLPSVRKVGIYSLPVMPLVMPNAIALRMVNTARHTFGLRVAQQIWVLAGLPVVPAMQLALAQQDLFLPAFTTEPNRHLDC